MSDKNENGAPPPNGEKKKRVVKRKPLWLLLPKDYEEMVIDDKVENLPTKYELYECGSKKEISDILSKLGLDASNTNLSHVKVIRGDQLPLKLSTQVTIKF